MKSWLLQLRIPGCRPCGLEPPRLPEQASHVRGRRFIFRIYIYSIKNTRSRIRYGGPCSMLLKRSYQNPLTDLLYTLRENEYSSNRQCRFVLLTIVFLLVEAPWDESLRTRLMLETSVVSVLRDAAGLAGVCFDPTVVSEGHVSAPEDLGFDSQQSCGAKARGCCAGLRSKCGRGCSSYCVRVNRTRSFRIPFEKPDNGDCAVNCVRDTRTLLQIFACYNRIPVE